MTNVSSELLSILKKLRDSGDIADIDNIVDQLTEVIERGDRRVYDEIKNMGDKIQQAKMDINESPDDSAVVEATMELDAVVKSTEVATNKILDAAENIQNLVGNCSDKELADKVSGDVCKIFEACNFQDLTGQRIKKVTATLNYIEETVGSLLRSFGDMPEKDTRKDADLMTGPQMDQNKPSQDDVDKLFDDV